MYFTFYFHSYFITPQIRKEALIKHICRQLVFCSTNSFMEAHGVAAIAFQTTHWSHMEINMYGLKTLKNKKIKINNF